MRRIVCLCLVFWMCFGLLAGCAVQPTEPTELTELTEPTIPETIKVVFSAKFLRIAQMSPEDWVQDLVNTSEGNYMDAYVNDDGETVTLEITQAQRSYWLEDRGAVLEGLRENFQELSDGYRMEISEDYTHIDLYYNLELDAYSAIYYVMYAENLCINMQLFNGVGAEEWFVSFNIYNSDTGKPVTSGDSNTGMRYDASDWEASE